MKSPVLFCVFNRFEAAERVFASIRRARPPRLYFAADGPRKEVKDDIIRCNKVRGLLQLVDWECEVYTLLRDQNIGCDPAVNESISWFFKNEEEGIILEDDCLPSDDFYAYCDIMLEYYRHNQKVSMISGRRALFDMYIGDSSYFFSMKPKTWGWATWKRSWSLFKYNLDEISLSKFERHLKKYSPSFDFFVYYSALFRSLKKHEQESWDYKYQIAMIIENKLCIIPNYNLIKNIGFDPSLATHTFNAEDCEKNAKYDLIFPLIHEMNIEQNKEADYYIYANSEVPNKLFLALRIRYVISVIKYYIKQFL